MWKKDDKRLSTRDKNLVVGADNSLSILAVRKKDAGTYVCVAKNDMGRKNSQPAALTISGKH